MTKYKQQVAIKCVGSDEDTKVAVQVATKQNW